MDFQLDKYLGKWYELAHSTTFFETSTDFNTFAEYTFSDDHINVLNCTTRNGKQSCIHGKAYYLGGNSLTVSFDGTKHEEDPPNYVIDTVWMINNDYFAAIVTNHHRNYVSLLCRDFEIPSNIYSYFLHYIHTHFDSPLIQVPHYK